MEVAFFESGLAPSPISAPLHFPLPSSSPFFFFSLSPFSPSPFFFPRCQSGSLCLETRKGGGVPLPKCECMLWFLKGRRPGFFKLPIVNSLSLLALLSLFSSLILSLSLPLFLLFLFTVSFSFLIASHINRVVKPLHYVSSIFEDFWIFGSIHLIFYLHTIKKLSFGEWTVKRHMCIYLHVACIKKLPQPSR